MSDNLYILGVSFEPVFNPDSAKIFQDFSREDSIQLYKALLLNHLEIYNSFTTAHKEIYLFNEADRDYLPAELSGKDNLIAFIKPDEGWKTVAGVLNSIYKKEKAEVLIFSINSIGFALSDIEKFYNLMSHEDKNVLIVRNKDGIVCLGMNYPAVNLFEGLELKNFSYDDLLPNVNKMHNYLFEIEDFLHINDMEDFRELYKLLSKKESVSFCSNESHNRFTNLFIEYKDKL